MKIAIDIREAGGEKAGKGWYTFYITRSLLNLDKKNEYILYAKTPVAGFESYKNARQKQIRGFGFLWHRNVASDLKKEKVDVFFGPTSYITPTFLPSSVKSVITVHDLVAFLFPENHNKKAVILEKLFLKKALKRSDHILCVSNNTKKDLMDIFKVPESKLSTVYCGVSEEFKPVDKNSLSKFISETNLPKKFFLAVGTISPRKNYLNLLRAFEIVNKSFPDYHLIMVGSKGWKYEEIENYIRVHYLTKKIHLLGYLSNKSLVALYNLSKGLVFPSFYEGFGIPPVEAMRCGCPVISSNISSLPEVVGDAALLIDPTNTQEISSAMESIISNENLAQTLSEKGLKQAEKFSWDLSAKKVHEIFLNFLN